MWLRGLAYFSCCRLSISYDKCVFLLSAVLLSVSAWRELPVRVSNGVTSAPWALRLDSAPLSRHWHSTNFRKVVCSIDDCLLIASHQEHLQEAHQPEHQLDRTDKFLARHRAHTLAR